MIELQLGDDAARRFSDLVLDYTGTLSHDGVLLPGVAERLTALAESIHITVLTADTFGKARAQLADLPIDLKIIETGRDKAAFVEERGAANVIAVGNGRNDVLMMHVVGLGIAIIGPEGAATELLRYADVVVTDIHHALDLFSNPLRLKATLRD